MLLATDTVAGMCRKTAQSLKCGSESAVGFSPSVATGFGLGNVAVATTTGTGVAVGDAST